MLIQATFFSIPSTLPLRMRHYHKGVQVLNRASLLTGNSTLLMFSYHTHTECCCCFSMDQASTVCQMTETAQCTFTSTALSNCRLLICKTCVLYLFLKFADLPPSVSLSSFYLPRSRSIFQLLFHPLSLRSSTLHHLVPGR